MRLLLQSILVFCIAALVAGLAYIAFTNAYAYKQTALQLQGLRQAVLNAPLWKYAVVNSVSPSTSSMIVQFGSTGKSFELEVSANAYIARQDLIGENGIYTSATSPTQATLADIRPGDNVFVVIVVEAGGRRSAKMILFGNPL